jgi:hypothetical protein
VARVIGDVLSATKIGPSAVSLLMKRSLTSSPAAEKRMVFAVVVTVPPDVGFAPRVP